MKKWFAGLTAFIVLNAILCDQLRAERHLRIACL